MERNLNGKGGIIAIVSVGIGLGALTAILGELILNGQSRMNSGIRSLQEDVGELHESMARLEGLFEGHLDREGSQ